MVRHLAEAKVVRNEGVELTAQSEDLVLVLLAEWRAAVVVASDAFEKVLDLGKIFVALQDGLLRKLTERHLADIVARIDDRLLHRGLVVYERHQVLHGWLEF